VYESPESEGKQDAKGISLVRRDSCALVKEVSQSIVHALLVKKDANIAIATAHEHILRILKDQEPLEKFVITKALRSGYKNDKQPHLAVAQKIHERRGYPVPSGERVPYVFIHSSDTPDSLQYLRVEDPGYVIQHPEIQLDTLYYINHQLKNRAKLKDTFN
jgi:DNA polymerase delta subunit 1